MSLTLWWRHNSAILGSNRLSFPRVSSCAHVLNVARAQPWSVGRTVFMVFRDWASSNQLWSFLQLKAMIRETIESLKIFPFGPGKSSPDAFSGRQESSHSITGSASGTIRAPLLLIFNCSGGITHSFASKLICSHFAARAVPDRVAVRIANRKHRPDVREPNSE